MDLDETTKPEGLANSRNRCYSMFFSRFFVSYENYDKIIIYFRYFRVMRPLIGLGWRLHLLFWDSRFCPRCTPSELEMRESLERRYRLALISILQTDISPSQDILRHFPFPT